MDRALEITLCVIAAIALAAIVVWITKLKTRGIARILINSAAGAALLLGFSAFGIISLPFNIFNAVIVGTLGVPGAAIVVAAALLL